MKRYSYDHKVSFSELDADSKMTLTTALSLFQDCSTYQSEFIGCGIDYLRENHRGWILSSWNVEVNRYPELNEELKVSTWACDFKGGFMGIRNFTLEDGNGEVLVAALTNWVYMNTLNGMPAKVPAAEIEAYGHDEPYPMAPASRKVKMPDGGIALDSFPVKRSDLDWNRHVNNTKYIQMASDLLPEAFEIHQMRAEYKKSAVLGDTIHPVIVESEKTVTISLNSADGDTFAVVEFKSL